MDGEVNLFERRKAKKVNVKVDYSMSLLYGRMLGVCVSLVLSFRRRDMVMGRRR